MDNRLYKVLAACALGAGIGSIVALSVHPYIWWLGMIAGGLVGYLAYEIKEVVRAMPTAWQRVTSPENRKKALGLTLFLAVPVSLSSSVFVISLIMHIYFPFGDSFMQSWGVVAGIIAGVCTLFFAAVFADSYWDSLYWPLRESDVNDLTKLAKILSPVGIPLFSLYVLFLAVKNTPTFVRFAAPFIKELFLLIHSEIRLLCGVDAALGAAAGYFLGEPVLGALIGAAIGVANYKIVSERILHIRPE